MAAVHGAMLSARAYGEPELFSTIMKPVLHRLTHRRDLGAVARVRDQDDRVGALGDHALDPRDGLLRFEVGVDDDFLFDRRAFLGDHLDLFLRFLGPVVQAAAVLDTEDDAFFAAPFAGAGGSGFGAAFFFAFGFGAAGAFGFSFGFGFGGRFRR